MLLLRFVHDIYIAQCSISLKIFGVILVDNYENIYYF